MSMSITISLDEVRFVRDKNIITSKNGVVGSLNRKNLKIWVQVPSS
jgi:hypothetical protein